MKQLHRGMGKEILLRIEYINPAAETTFSVGSTGALTIR
jgi:hypothetical protein